MKHYFSCLFISLVVALTATAALAGSPTEIAAEAKNSFIFKFDASVPTSEMQGLAETLTEAKGGTLRHVFTNVLHGFSATMSRANAQSLVSESDGKVTGFVNNGVAHVPGAGGSGGAKGGKGGKGKPTPTPAGEIVSWGVPVVGGSKPATAATHHAWIIDSGIDDYYNGTELNIGEGTNFVSKGQDTTDDTNGHGTHIAGILAAIAGNDTGVVGIASGATVHPVRVLHKNLWGTVDDIMAGVDYVAGKIAAYPTATTKHVVNMSLTIERATNDVTAFDEAVNALADLAPIAVCAGNDGVDASLYSPAYLPNTNIYTVASIDDEYTLASDSNTGDDVDFVAPGVAIESLKPGGGTWFWSGCSMATPHVAGILLFQAPPTDGGGGSIAPLATFE